MYTYMEYLQKCFYKSTGWEEDNIFANITASSQAILDFGIPNGGKVDISSKSSDYSASSFTLSNYNVINGSLAYLYSSIPLKNTLGTKNVSLQEAISGFKILEPNDNSATGNSTFTNSITSSNNGPNSITEYNRNSLLYGRMYFPGAALEAMIIKRLSKQSQLLVKSISNPNLSKNGTMIIYLQNNTSKYLREFVYSTNEALIGFRCLYNFGRNPQQHHHHQYQYQYQQQQQQYQQQQQHPDKSATSPKKLSSQPLPIIPQLDNSVVSIGAEIWYAAMTMSPGLSTALRYATRSTVTGKPLTMTIACNPILGQLSSTYTVKTSAASSFSSKYDFNLYSYASNLSLGFELYNYSKKASPYDDHSNEILSSSSSLLLFPSNSSSSNSSSTMSTMSTVNSSNQKETVISAFQHLVNESDFSSVFKLSTSLNDKMIKLLWEGRCKDFLVSAGTRLGLNPITNQPEFNKVGISFSYAS